ncbi:MAG TPA: M56 family metallopeptidase [Flavobacteriales bacterium]|nr:M56 family metallopeptidase [Flavobacteriales bacterium]HMR29037.1 M56 family metallopeptidase [Flavobacteriales bacterium]
MDLLPFYLQANIAFAVLLIAYVVGLRNSPLLGARRAFLLLIPVWAVALPLLPRTAVSAALAPVALPLITVRPDAGAPLEPAASVIAVHCGVSLVLIVRLLWRIASAGQAVRQGGPTAMAFLGRVHLPVHLAGAEREAVRQHELAHVRLGHSYDVIAFELLAALCWTNPLWWMALRELRLVHELQADRAAARTAPDYALNLLAHALGTDPRHLLHPFNRSFLNTRMLMLTTSPSPRRALARALPTLAFAMLGLAWIAATPLSAPDADAVVLPGSDRGAEYPGGMPALAAYLGKAVTYPAGARADGVEGTVYIAFTVQADGRVTDASLKRGVRSDLDQEALRVVSAMPAWTPAAKDGKPVASQMTLPIDFKLGGQ